MLYSAIQPDKNTFFSLSGRLFSAAIWLLIFYLAVPLIQAISGVENIAFAFIVAASIFLFDTSLFKRSNVHSSFEYKSIVAGRIALSIIMSILGGFAVTLITFWSFYRSISKHHGGNHIQAFMQMIESNVSVL